MDESYTYNKASEVADSSTDTDEMMTPGVSGIQRSVTINEGLASSPHHRQYLHYQQQRHLNGVLRTNSCDVITSSSLVDPASHRRYHRCLPRRYSNRHKPSADCHGPSISDTLLEERQITRGQSWDEETALGEDAGKWLGMLVGEL
jgi:hypothetical protein